MAHVSVPEEIPDCRGQRNRHSYVTFTTVAVIPHPRGGMAHVSVPGGILDRRGGTAHVSVPRGISGRRGGMAHVTSIVVGGISDRRGGMALVASSVVGGISDHRGQQLKR